MTDQDTTPDAHTPQGQPNDEGTRDETPVSDDQQQDGDSGTHGRPTDDSDPGHS
ncbi:hypothetical protein [Deinococcus maricopensis]|uniref:Uncharacterized protein n=1 Tax=Deinococcus maricopensis (strain DSM 21211 / LMG 22137 / NRRL B-23946 / LB-34) TaxID=709986 RepID=E8U8X8_DEIML|nr:hypothetical protein [Deinococcus maricopensis]ADV67517.1 hypothetical protein Deima_1871 [Deinococcus maricopensis DSM 21211]